ncbi:MAG TPA: hypothetical protein VF556_00245 [Pyrinomonadaceae bacterium]|jgi:hypothetical protein
MKKIKQFFEYASAVDFLTVLIAAMSLSFLIAAFSASINPEKFAGVFRELLAYSLLSFITSCLILKPLEFWILSKLPFKLVWLLTIICGTFGFACFFAKTFYIDFSLFFSFFAVALIPSASFRFSVNFAVSYWIERKELSKFSIVK